jgi:antitoxin PrlF
VTFYLLLEQYSKESLHSYNKEYMMITSKISSKAQTTIPKKVREKLNIHTNDTIVFEIEDDYAIIRKVNIIDTGYLKALESTLEEWNSEEDSVYDDL